MQRTFKMTDHINDVFTTMMVNQIQDPEEKTLFNTLILRSTRQLEFIYVAAHVRPDTVTPEMQSAEMRSSEMRNAQLFVQYWSPSVLPQRVADLAMQAMLI